MLENPKSTPPSIDSLEVTPLSKDSYAPATFRIHSQVKNAQLCVWDFGDEGPLEFSADVGKGQDRFVTFKKPGGYVIKLAAVNGDQAKERTEIIYVDEPPKGTVTAILSVSDQGTRMEKRSLSLRTSGYVSGRSRVKLRSISSIVGRYRSNSGASAWL